MNFSNGSPITSQIGAYNTYIGARYVPIFDGEWDNTKNYEPLTIVSYQGNSYTSKQYVPAGVQIINDSYWALTGNYNGQIEQLRKDVDNLQNISSQLPPIINQFYTNKNFYVFIGDLVDLAGNGDGWINRVANSLGLSSSQYVNLSMGGVGFSYSLNNTVLSQWNTISNLYNKVTHVIIGVGVNDFDYISTTLRDNVKASISKIKNDVPNAKIYIFMNGLNYSKFINYSDIETYYFQGASGLATYIDGGFLSWYSSLYWNDYIRPNNEGSNRIAEFVLGFLSNSNYTQYSNTHLTFTPNPGIIANVDLSINISHYSKTVVGKISGDNLDGNLGTFTPAIPFNSLIGGASSSFTIINNVLSLKSHAGVVNEELIFSVLN